MFGPALPRFQAKIARAGPNGQRRVNRLESGGFEAQFAHDHGRRAEAGEGRLQEVRPDEHGQPDEVRRDGDGEQNGEQNHEASEGHDGLGYGHSYESLC